MPSSSQNLLYKSWQNVVCIFWKKEKKKKEKRGGSGT